MLTMSGQQQDQGDKGDAPLCPCTGDGVTAEEPEEASPSSPTSSPSPPVTAILCTDPPDDKSSTPKKIVAGDVVFEDELKKEATSPSKESNKIQNLLQLHAANVLSNFRAGLSLQPDQFHLSKVVRERTTKEHRNRQRHDDGDKSEDSNPDGRGSFSENCQMKRFVEDCGAKSDDTKAGSTSRPGDDGESNIGAKEENDGVDDGLMTVSSSPTSKHYNNAKDPTINPKTPHNKQSIVVSPAGVLDLPSFLSSSSTPKPDEAVTKATETETGQQLPSSPASFSPSIFLGGSSSLLSSLTSPKHVGNEGREAEVEGFAEDRKDSVKDESSDDDDDAEVAHEFVQFTYRKPTTCDVCEGLLVGLWHQGLRCKFCGINVHHGEGAVHGLNCRAEALLKEGGCRRHFELMKTRSAGPRKLQSDGDENTTQASSPNNNTVDSSVVSLSEAVQQVRQFARERPSFLQDVKAQMDRDLKSRVKRMIVSQGAEEQRSKAILKLRTEYVVPTLKLLDRIESQGWKVPYAILFAVHCVLTVLVSIFSWMGTSAGLYGGVSSTNTVKWGHNVTILYFFHLALALTVLIVRRLINVLHRRSRVLDEFILQVFSLSPGKDIGITMQQLASRLRLWIRRVTITTSTMLLLSLVVYRWSHLTTTDGTVCVGVAKDMQNEIDL